MYMRLVDFPTGAMNENEGEEGEESEEAFWVAANRFLTDHKKGIGELISVVAQNMRASVKQKGWTTLAVFVLLAGIVFAVSFLALIGIVSGEAVAFLVGVIVGYLFSFLRRSIWGVT